MGCDIHLYVEYYDREAKEWKLYDEEFPNPDYNPNEEWGAKQPQFVDQLTPGYSGAYEDDGSIKEWYKDEYLFANVYHGRNYDLFSILADVRNGYGFAGIPTGSRIIPVLESLYQEPPCRGLPSSVSPLVKRKSDDWNGDGHSHNWLTLEELKRYPWKGHFKTHLAYVDPVGFREWSNGGFEFSGYGDVTGENVHKVENDEMQNVIDMLDKGELTIDEDGKWHPLINGNIYITRVTWQEDMESCAGYFCKETIPLLESFLDKKNIGASELRIVFWFDN